MKNIKPKVIKLDFRIPKTQRIFKELKAISEWDEMPIIYVAGHKVKGGMNLVEAARDETLDWMLEAG